MAGFVIRGFRGMRPIMEPKLLETSEAQVATDVRLFSGDIEPVKGNQSVVTLKSTDAVTTIFRGRDSEDESLNWLEFSGDVDVAFSPITQDEYGRLYWTGEDVPRYATTTQAFAAGSSAYPRASFKLGIPKPSNAPVALGTSVATPETADREYVITHINDDGSKESAPSDSSKAKALTDVVDMRTMEVASFTINSSTAATVVFKQSHELLEKDFIGITGSTDAGWNAGWEVSGVVDSLTIKITNTQTFPPSPPTGDYVVKQRYLAKTKLVSMPTSTGGNSNITKKRIYRKVGTTYRLVDTVAIETAEYEDSKLDSEISSNPTLATLNVPDRPGIAPAVLVPFDDTSIADNAAAETPVTVYQRVYAISYVHSDGTQGPLSKASGVVSVIDGVTKVRLTHGENVSDEILKKRLYRQDLTYAAGTYNLLESGYRLVAELPVSQDTYEDTAAQSVVASHAAPALVDALDRPTSAFGVSATLPPKVIPDSRVYVYTYVSEYGEEGNPSEPSTLIDIDPGEPVVITMDSAPTGYSNIAKKYLYRTSTGSNGTDYQFLAEIPVETTTYSDLTKAADLGEVIPSKGWEAPPSTLKGLRVMANGIFVGFSNKDVCFSEAFMPHAWNSANFLPVDYKIVGLGAFGQSVAVLTESYPYIATGVDPQAMTLVKTSLQQACVSKRSIVETGDSVIYASPDGLVKISLGGVDILTMKMLSQAQWQEFNPSSIHAYIHEGRYYAFYTKTDGTKGQLCFSLIGNDAPFSMGSQWTAAAHVVPKADSLFIVEDGSIKMMDKGSASKPYIWKSKRFENPQPLNFGAAQILCADYGSGVTMKIYADGSLVTTQTVTSSAPYRIPSGYKARHWEVQVEGTAIINMIAITQSITELQQL